MPLKEKKKNTMAERYLTDEEKERAKRSIIDMYKQLGTFLKSEKYKKDLKMELELSQPDFVGSINKRIEDMEKTDHGIVIAGETSAGKSTLINKILGKIIFIGTTSESTSTICKIRNLERVRIITENLKGEIDETDLTATCDIQSQSGEKLLRTTLTDLTDMTSSGNFKEVKYVDVGFPIPFLQENTILVDTPGIGGAVEFTQKLMEYLPNALSFIFVISVERAGGMQDDRLPSLLESIKKLRNKNEMPCFDPEDVIFITNKWDCIRSQLDVEKEKEKVWEKTKRDIKRKWEFVKEEHIFRMNCLDVFLNAENENVSTKEFIKFRKVLLANVEKAKNIRFERHFRYLLDLLENVSKGLHARLHLKQMSADTQNRLTELHLRSIQDLKLKCEKIRKSVLEKTALIIEDIATDCYEKMSKDSEKKIILNPSDVTPMIEVKWHPTRFANEINIRITEYVNNRLQSEQVLQKFEDVKNEIISFYREVSTDLSAMENQWTNVVKTESFGEYRREGPSDQDDLPLQIKIPVVALSVLVMVALVALGIMVSPVLIPTLLIMSRDDRKRRIIDEVYDKHKDKIRGEIRKHLKKNCGDPLNDLVENVTKDLLPSRIKFLENMIKTLLQTREKILMDMETLEELKKKVDAMKISASKIQAALNEFQM